MEWTESVRKSWCASAPPVRLSFPDAGVVSSCTPKLFSSGSVGWFLSRKEELQGVRCQITVSITAIGSKPPMTPLTGVTIETKPEGMPLLDAIADAAAEKARRPRRKRSTDANPSEPPAIDPGASGAI